MKIRNSILFFLIALISTASLLMLGILGGCTKEPNSRNVGEKKLKVVAIFATPIEEPWDGVIHKALLKAQKELGIEYKYTDNVQATNFEKTLRNFADENYDVIIGDAFAAEEIVRRVARDYPEIAFVFGSGLGPAEPNFSVFDNWIHEPAYLAGMVAGSLTKTNVIGAVGGYPVPEVNRILNAFKAGAKEINPKVKFKISFIGSWFDPPKAKEATLTLIAQDADVMYAERAGVIEACVEKGIPVFGNLLDQHKSARNFVVSSVLWDMWPTVKDVIESVKAKNYISKNYFQWSMMAKGGAHLASFRSWEKNIEKSILGKVSQRKDEIIAGKFRVPIIESIPKGD